MAMGKSGAQEHVFDLGTQFILYFRLGFRRIGVLMEADDAPFSQLGIIGKSDSPLDTHPETTLSSLIPTCESFGRHAVHRVTVCASHLDGYGDPGTGRRHMSQRRDEHLHFTI